MKKGFFDKKKIIGMIHLLPLPGTPHYSGNNQLIEDRAISDAEKLVMGGVDSFIVENFDDELYDTKINIEAYTLMANIVQKLKDKFNCPFGINIQFNCFREEWALAYVLKADFIRVEAFVEARYGYFGKSGPCAIPLLRLIKEFPSKTLIFADINCKQSFGLPGITPIDAAQDAIIKGADALIITGKRTGENPSIEDIIEIREKIGDFPILVGSGVTEDNIKGFLNYADGIIVGSYFKEFGNVKNAIDLNRVRKLIKASKN